MRCRQERGDEERCRRKEYEVLWLILIAILSPPVVSKRAYKKESGVVEIDWGLSNKVTLFGSRAVLEFPSNPQVTILQPGH